MGTAAAAAPSQSKQRKSVGSRLRVGDKTTTTTKTTVRFHGGAPEAVAAMASDPSTQSRVMFQATEKTEEPSSRRLGKLTVKYNRKDLQRRLDIEEWIDEQLHLLFDCEVREGCLGTEHTHRVH